MRFTLNESQIAPLRNKKLKNESLKTCLIRTILQPETQPSNAPAKLLCIGSPSIHRKTNKAYGVVGSVDSSIIGRGAKQPIRNYSFTFIGDPEIYNLQVVGSCQIKKGDSYKITYTRNDLINSVLSSLRITDVSRNSDSFIEDTLKDLLDLDTHSTEDFNLLGREC